MNMLSSESFQLTGIDRFCELPNGLTLCYRTYGEEAATPLVLIAGLGLQLTSWPHAMISHLVAQGYQVIAFDNRDMGRSSRIATPPPGKLRQLLRRARPEDYDLGDMADDTVGLLDHLGVAQAHLVGMSMGGMIAQMVAARHPKRTRTLTSIFSTTGSLRVGQPTLSSLWLLTKPPALTQEQAVARHLALLTHLACPTHPVDQAEACAYARDAWERAGGPSHAGFARQIGAIIKSGDRTEQLRRIQAPTLVIHGDRDKMVHPSGGKATAAAIAGARHETIPGMGHHFPPGILPRLLELITDHARP